MKTKRLIYCTNYQYTTPYLIKNGEAFAIAIYLRLLQLFSVTQITRIAQARNDIFILIQM